MTDPLVTADWLFTHMDQVDIVDATYYMPADPAKARADFQSARIPGAVHFEIDEIVDKGSALPHMLPDAATFSRAVADLGIEGTRPVVIYDRSINHFSAPRVWFTLRMFGIVDCYVLDGGFNAWTGHGLPVSAGDRKHRPAAPRAWNRDDRRVVGAAEMVAAVAAQSGPIFDARSNQRFEGTAAEPRPELKSGHMRGASCVPFTSLTRQDGSFADVSTLRRFFGNPTDAQPIVTCGSGLTACILALGLARLGHEARLYDGSWAEWGRGTLGDIQTGPA